MPVYQFGSGVLFATPNAGDLATNPTPMQFGTLQEVQVDIAFDTKQLHGRNQFPDDVARAKAKITGKAKFARFSAKLVNDLFFGQTLAVGQIKVALDETATVPTTPFQVTVTNAAQFREDLGVMYSTNRKPLVRVAAGPTVGQYAVNTGTGIYTFAAADVAAVMLISYTFNVAATGANFTVKNKLMGFGPRFSCVLMQEYSGSQSDLKLYRSIANKLTRPTKTDDYTVPEFDFESFADDSGNVFDWQEAEQ
jgi:hypothetical protein